MEINGTRTQCNLSHFAKGCTDYKLTSRVSILYNIDNIIYLFLFYFILFMFGLLYKYRYFGKVDGLPDDKFVGVELDEPLGKNNGSYKGKEYFVCQNNFGVFVRPPALIAGDYPPINELEEDI